MNSIKKNIKFKLKLYTSCLILFLLLINFTKAETSTNAWIQFPLKNKWQYENGFSGGEGMQMVMDIDWNLKNTEIIYMVTDTTRVWKSTDRGGSWNPLMQDNKITGGVSIASDPINENVVLVAASDCIDYIETDNDGIYRSVDGGTTWTGPIGGSIHFIKRHAGKLFLFDDRTAKDGKTQIIYAGTPNGLLMSNNGGSTWYKIGSINGDVFDLEWSRDKEFIFVSTGNNLYKYYPITNSAVKVNNLPEGILYDVSSSKLEKSSVYFAFGKGGVWKSKDEGTSFFKLGNWLHEGFSYQRIKASASNFEIIYAMPDFAGGDFPYTSSDAGRTWVTGDKSSYNEWLGEGYFYASPIEFDPDNSNIAISQRSGPIVKTFDAGKTWHYSGDGYTGARLNDIDFISKDKMLFCLMDYGVFYTDNNGKYFKEINVPRIDDKKSCTAISSSENRIVAAIGDWNVQNIVVSDDFGNSWVKSHTVKEDFDFIKINSKNRDIIYANNWVSYDGGKKWNKLNYNIKAVNEKNNDTVIGVTEVHENKWQVLVSFDAARSWKTLGDPINAGDLGDAVFMGETLNDMNILIASADKSIYKYRNNRWVNLENNLGFFNNEGLYYLTVDPYDFNTIWAGKRGNEHSDGVYVSTNNGVSWDLKIANLGKYNNIWNIEINPFDSTVYLTGPGVWKKCNGACNFSNNIVLSNPVFSSRGDDALLFEKELNDLFLVSGFVKFSDKNKKIYTDLINKYGDNFNEKNKFNLATFIEKGTESTKDVGSGERGGVLNSYSLAYGKLPGSISEWDDVIKITNGHWPGYESEFMEKMANITFQNVYLRSIDNSNQNDIQALKIISYGILPKNRNLNSEITAIKIFRDIYKKYPESTLEWNIIKSIAYSGSTR